MRWTADDSEDLDRQIKRLRVQERAGRPMPGTRKKQTVKPRRLPEPRQQASGRWLAVININRQRYKQWFDTRGQAQAWIKSMDKER